MTGAIIAVYGVGFLYSMFHYSVVNPLMIWSPQYYDYPKTDHKRVFFYSAAWPGIAMLNAYRLFSDRRRW